MSDFDENLKRYKAESKRQEEEAKKETDYALRSSFNQYKVSNQQAEARDMSTYRVILHSFYTSPFVNGYRVPCTWEFTGDIKYKKWPGGHVDVYFAIRRQGKRTFNRFLLPDKVLEIAEYLWVHEHYFNLKAVPEEVYYRCDCL